MQTIPVALIFIGYFRFGILEGCLSGVLCPVPSICKHLQILLGPTTWISHLIGFFRCFCRPRTREPARRRVHQRAAASESHPAENCWTRGGGRSTLRNLPSAACLARMCVENPQSLPGDRLDSAGRDWRQQAESRHARNWESHRGHEERKSGNFLVGNPRTVDQGGHLWQAIRAIGEFHQPTFASKEWRRRWNRNS